MTSRERLQAAWGGRPQDKQPLTAWTFGFQPPRNLKWEKSGNEVPYWYSMRLEHTCTLPIPWTVEDELKRVLALQSIGIDDMLEISVPWSLDPAVQWKDSRIERIADRDYTELIREYYTPSGKLRHAVKKTDEIIQAGWVVQPEHVPLFEDFNIPRGTEHAVSKKDDISIIRHLYRPPHGNELKNFKDQETAFKQYKAQHDIAVQAWATFGMDAVVWLCGVEGAVYLAMDDRNAFRELVEIIFKTDYARAKIACESPVVDIVVQRGWYSSTDFWSPKLFEEFVFPYITEIAKLCHLNDKKFAYVMTTGVKQLGSYLVEAGVDVLYFVDPVQDTISLQEAREFTEEGMTLAGGTNAVTLLSNDREKIFREAHAAIEELGPTNRFVLHAVDGIFPDTPWKALEYLIEARDAYS